MAKYLLIPVALAVFASCSPTLPPVPQCSEDPDCGELLVCDNGTCVAPLDGGCRTDETRPCGPPGVGTCIPGVQRCVDGAFEANCTGQVSPAAETCNGLDDDCDGLVDDAVLLTFYVDRDGDGFGSSASSAESRQACALPAGFSSTNTDCNDASASINSAAVELCDAANVDEDCDGMANEGCGCATPGMSQACCAGRGNQTCEARDGGNTLSVCTVSASTEVCNAIDDDCDGQADEQYRIISPDGGAVVIDGGVINLDGGCTVGVGACARSSAASCTSGSLGCATTAGTPTNELCNQLDDDCDGETDEISSTLCPVTGQACTAGTCACPTGESICGSSCQAVGGACSQGTGACARQGTVQCTSGSASCSATAGTPAPETCNNIDDDCDGQTDEGSDSSCPATGQTCSIGTCVCPGGQSVCGASCQTLGGSCSAGVGACQRTGAIACISGGASCDATAGSPVAEICDGADNDCDGTIDNGVTVTCYPDGDNDRYFTDSTVSVQCRDAARGTFGFCPLGFVATNGSLGVDCSPANSALYRVVSTLADADNDTYCVGAFASTCMGVTAPAGRRIASSCVAGAQDCNDNNAAVFQMLNVRSDGDNDGFCINNASMMCSGAAPAPGFRLVSSCQATADCNDASAAQFILRNVRTDADGDGYCVNPAFDHCGGSTQPPNTRPTPGCQATDDCKDNNNFATTACYIASRYQTTAGTKQCGFLIPASDTFLVSATTFCPPGFSRIGTPLANVTGGAPGGNCTAISDTNVTMNCGSVGFGSFTCEIRGDCAAN